MRVPADKPSTAASLKHRPLFAPLILPMLGFVAALLIVIWLALAYQQTTTVIIGVWDDAPHRSAMLQLAGRVEVDAAYALEQSPFVNNALVFPGDPLPVRPLGAAPDMLENIGDGSVLLLVHKDDLPVLMQALDLSATEVASGSLLVITIPSLGKASIVRVLPGEKKF